MYLAVFSFSQLTHCHHWSFVHIHQSLLFILWLVTRTLGHCMWSLCDLAWVVHLVVFSFSPLVIYSILLFNNWSCTINSWVIRYLFIDHYEYEYVVYLWYDSIKVINLIQLSVLDGWISRWKSSDDNHHYWQVVQWM